MKSIINSNKLQHFFVVLAMDWLIFFGCAQVFYSSIYIKELDFYMPQRMFVTIMVIIIAYNCISTIFFDCNNIESYITYCIVPVGIISTIVVSQ